MVAARNFVTSKRVILRCDESSVMVMNEYHKEILLYTFKSPKVAVLTTDKRISKKFVLLSLLI